MILKSLIIIFEMLKQVTKLSKNDFTGTIYEFFLFIFPHYILINSLVLINLLFC